VKVVLSDLAMAACADPRVDVVVPGGGVGGKAQPNPDPCNADALPGCIAEWVGGHDRSITRAGRVLDPPARSLEAIRT